MGSIADSDHRGFGGNWPSAPDSYWRRRFRILASGLVVLCLITWTASVLHSASCAAADGTAAGPDGTAAGPGGGAGGAAQQMPLTEGVPRVTTLSWNREAASPGCAGSLPAGASGAFDVVAMAGGKASPIAAITLTSK